MVAVTQHSAIAAALVLALCVWMAGQGLDLSRPGPDQHAQVRVSAAFEDAASVLLFGQAAPAPMKDCCDEPNTCEQCPCHLLFLVQAEQPAPLTGPGSLLPSGPAHLYEQCILGPPSPPPPFLS